MDDQSAIASWAWGDEPDPAEAGYGQAYRCCDCAWSGRGSRVYDHHKATGHALRGRDWPADWPNAIFSDEAK